ncbi:recombinase family protein [Streptomyces sp. NPDC002187]|uniref:recombinase family protein n=1 Tax=Streptomyces sp. NPDC002187 TaxID=3364637 RepID=UPI0036BFB380
MRQGAQPLGIQNNRVLFNGRAIRPLQRICHTAHRRPRRVLRKESFAKNSSRSTGMQGDAADLLAPVPAVRRTRRVLPRPDQGPVARPTAPRPHRCGLHPDLHRQKSGKNAEREELRRALNCLREGDTLVVPSLDRLGRSVQNLIAIVAGLRKRGVGFTSLHKALHTTTPGGRLVSTSSPPWRSSSASSSFRAPTRAWNAARAAPTSAARRP